MARTPIAHRSVPLTFIHYVSEIHLSQWNDEYFHDLNHAHWLVVRVDHHGALTYTRQGLMSDFVFQGQ